MVGFDYWFTKAIWAGIWEVGYVDEFHVFHVAVVGLKRKGRLR